MGVWKSQGRPPGRALPGHLCWGLPGPSPYILKLAKKGLALEEGEGERGGLRQEREGDR